MQRGDETARDGESRGVTSGSVERRHTTRRKRSQRTLASESASRALNTRSQVRASVTHSRVRPRRRVLRRTARGEISRSRAADRPLPTPTPRSLTRAHLPSHAQSPRASSHDDERQLRVSPPRRCVPPLPPTSTLGSRLRPDSPPPAVNTREPGSPPLSLPPNPLTSPVPSRFSPQAPSPRP